MRTSAAGDRNALRDDDGRYESDDERDEPRCRTSEDRAQRAPGLFWRTVRLIRLLVFLVPLSLLLIGSFVVDCRNPSRTALLPEFVRTSACAREELVGRLSAMNETMRTISQAIR